VARTGYSYPAYLKARILELLVDPTNLVGGNLLGTYESGAGRVMPAIRVGDSPRRISGSGLEVIIAKLPTDQSIEQVSNPDGCGRTYVTGRQQFFLLQHRNTAVGHFVDEEIDGDEDTIAEANDRLVRWMACGNGRYTPRDDTKQLIEQIAYTIDYHWSLQPLGHNNTGLNL
jgi:hypothetical protein